MRTHVVDKPLPIRPLTACAPILDVDRLCAFDATARLCDVSFAAAPAETLVILGEGGAGKTLLAKTIVRLTQPTGGHIRVDGHDVGGLTRRELRLLRGRVQTVFGSARAALNPRMRVSRIIAEPLALHRARSRRIATTRVRGLLKEVGLDPAHADSYPTELSPVEIQRVRIARALASKPEVLVTDEPTGDLAGRAAADILDLLVQLRPAHGLTYVLTTRDPRVAWRVADRIAVLHTGRIVEVGDTETIIKQPAHPYTYALMASVPIADPQTERFRRQLRDAALRPQRSARSAINSETACPFCTYCPRAARRCASEAPPLADPGIGHEIACHYPEMIEHPADPFAGYDLGELGTTRYID